MKDFDVLATNTDNDIHENFLVALKRVMKDEDFTKTVFNLLPKIGSV